MSTDQDIKNVKEQGQKVVEAVTTMANNTMADVTKKVEEGGKAINDGKNKILWNVQEVAKNIGDKANNLLEKAKTA